VTAVGVTSQVEGLVAIDPTRDDLGQVVTMTVDLRDLRTDDPMRDEKLADRWLVTNQYPYASFVSTGIENASGNYQEGQDITFQLNGSLTIRDVTLPVSFDTRARLEGDVLTGEAETTIKMSDYGIDPPDLLGFVTVEDEVKLTVHLVAKESSG
jgi:polyisoprenoid-binding protein YceI